MIEQTKDDKIEYINVNHIDTQMNHSIDDKMYQKILKKFIKSHNIHGILNTIRCADHENPNHKLKKYEMTNFMISSLIINFAGKNIELESQYVEKFMSLGFHINNHSSPNTIQYFINTISSKCQYEFSLNPGFKSNDDDLHKIIKILMTHGATINYNEMLNSVMQNLKINIFDWIFTDYNFGESTFLLTFLLQKMIPSAKIKSNNIINNSNKDTDIQFACDLIKKMILGGIISNNSQSSDNTFSMAIRTENIQIINLILELNPKAYNSRKCLRGMFNKKLDISDWDLTLELAINTFNPRIVEIAIQNGALPHNDNIHHDIYNSTLHLAVSSFSHNNYKSSLDIMFQIVAFKASNHNFSMWFLQSIYNLESQYQLDKETINKIINIILCSGTRISDIFEKRIVMKPWVKRKMYACVKLSNHKKYYSKNHSEIERVSDSMEQQQQQDVRDLIKELNEMTKNLIERPDEKKRMKDPLISGLDNFPECLIELIHQYLWIPSTIKKIDW